MASYQVIRSDEFQRQLDALGYPAEQLDEVLDAVEDALARNPLVGRKIEKFGGVWVLVGHPRRAMPIAFYYTLHEGWNRVTLVGLRPIRM